MFMAFRGKFLLQAHATDENIRGAVKDINKVRQRPGETEASYALSVETAHAKSGNIKPLLS